MGNVSYARIAEIQAAAKNAYIKSRTCNELLDALHDVYGDALVELEARVERLRRFVNAIGDLFAVKKDAMATNLLDGDESCGRDLITDVLAKIESLRDRANGAEHDRDVARNDLANLAGKVTDSLEGDTCDGFVTLQPETVEELRALAEKVRS